MLGANGSNKENFAPQQPDNVSKAKNELIKKQAMLVLLCLESSNLPIFRQDFCDRLDLCYASSPHYVNAVGKAISDARNNIFA